MKFCKDCVHFRKQYSEYCCFRKATRWEDVNPVTAKKKTGFSNYNSCSNERFGDEFSSKDGECGIDAKFFKKASAFRKIMRILGRERL